MAAQSVGHFCMGRDKTPRSRARALLPEAGRAVRGVSSVRPGSGCGGVGREAVEDTCRFVAAVALTSASPKRARMRRPKDHPPHLGERARWPRDASGAAGMSSRRPRATDPPRNRSDCRPIGLSPLSAPSSSPQQRSVGPRMSAPRRWSGRSVAPARCRRPPPQSGRPCSGR